MSKIIRDKDEFVLETGSGIYLAGVDIHPGTIRLMAFRPKDCSASNIYYEVVDNPNDADAQNKFIDQTYVVVNSGQFLVIECISQEDRIRIEYV